MKKRKLKKSVKFVIFLFVVLVVVLGYFGVSKFLSKGDIGKDNKKDKVVKKLKIFDQDSDSRIVAVMINNNHQAWPHAGLDKSFLNYEIIAEGGITRIMSLFKDVDVLDKIGSVRSSRPYFLDYVLENDAIYVHWGGSDAAYSDIKSLGIDNIDAITYEGKYFFRDKSANKIYEHTGFTKMSMIKDAVSNLNIKSTSNKDMVFNYSVDEINLDEMEGATKADNINVNYSNYHTTSYVYDEGSKTYLRSMSDKGHVDAVSGVQYSAKNIITYQVKNKSYDSYGRQKLENIGSGDGYYITNGYSVPITWEKASRSSKTIYKYKSNGEEIKLNDGNTWVQIQPLDKSLEIIGNNPDVQE